MDRACGTHEGEEKFVYLKITYKFLVVKTDGKKPH